ncbi:hypothetical protein [Fibrobacter sp. UWB5]|uniref:hypothetical protein n=1 Tax=Fibrobacter sp. UWB5 TaxID=1964360 RepID=UPI000B52075C|nr:hypothetical protein [Fibrobacter sp. UWB5]OWV14374.1 hypothetical protein B7989_02655 [Fibrobacter sp. UWB5]
MSQMKNVTLKSINISGNRCEYVFEYPDEMSRYIADGSQTLFVELPAQYNLKDVPEALLAVPFVGGMMCVTMLLGYGIKVPELDKTFFESVPHIKNAFHKMFPYAKFCFDVDVEKIVDCCYETQNVPSVFFSGGLDATSALIEHIEENPLMINIYGGDLLLTDTDSHVALDQYFRRLTGQIGNEYAFVKSNCRRFFNERKIEIDYLDNILKPEENHGWWASIAHILSMSSVIAPIEYLTKTAINYIGSGYSSKSKGFDANNINMVNAIKFASCRFSLVDDSLERDDKVTKVIKYCTANKLNVEIKVCWFAKASENCSHCEKCYRTILEILSNHANPNDYGFRMDAQGYKEMHKFAKYNMVNTAFWGASQKAFLADKDYWAKKKEISWILDFDFNNPRRLALYGLYRKVRGFAGRVKRKIIG